MLALISVSKDAVLSHMTQYTFQAFKYLKHLKTTTKRCWLIERVFIQSKLGPSWCEVLRDGEYKPYSAIQALKRYFSHAHIYLVACI